MPASAKAIRVPNRGARQYRSSQAGRQTGTAATTAYHPPTICRE
ncbi:hypothetical protein ACFPPB_10735 [Rhodanobacter terrae]|uniref:Uncharacterized protein n=1 Tax=Rhodanobacter terrae TaxID=418647 RepID=A0ABW0SXJ4_9GAMM